MLVWITFISAVLAADDCTLVKDQEFVPHCGKCMYDQQCIGWNSFKEAANAIGRASFVYCCPNLKRCLQADPENPDNYRYELMGCPSGDGFPAGDDTKPAECMKEMTEEVQQANWRGSRTEPGCSERSQDYPAGCKCGNSDWPNNWVTGCEDVEPTPTEAPPAPAPEGGYTCTCDTRLPVGTKVCQFSDSNGCVPEFDKCEIYQGFEMKCTVGAAKPETEAPKKETEPPKKGEETTEKPAMSCDTCAAGFVADGGCPLWKAAAGPEALMEKIPKGCDPEQCGDAMFQACQACDDCATGFAKNGGCEVAMAGQASEAEMNALLPKGCSGEQCMASIGALCMATATMPCDECASQFLDNGGCEVALRGDNPSDLVPKACNPEACSDTMMTSCMNAHQAGELNVDSSETTDMNACPDVSCECKDYENAVITKDDDGCEECTCIPKCNCMKKQKCQGSKLPKCRVSKISRCPDKEKIGRRKNKRWVSAVACMSEEEQAEWANTAMVAFEEDEVEEMWTIEDGLVYSFAAIGLASLAYFGFSKLQKSRSYSLVTEYPEGEL